MHEALRKCSLMNIIIHSTVDYIYINISPKPQPKSRLKASKILSPGHGPSKLLYMASHGLGYRRLGSASLRPEAEPLTSLNQFLCKVFDLRRNQSFCENVGHHFFSGTIDKL